MVTVIRRNPPAAGRAIRRLAAWAIVVATILGAGTGAFAVVERHARAGLAGLVRGSPAAGSTTGER